ncbi:hypothetical protein C8J57DRAFT_1253646 [Mycena rebaudengoi]|nr:hypothetical protein C8J57DRAFT_1253646 [Mycena rebaudengoi]
MANTDSEMPAAYDDSEYYIEDRTTRRTFHQRKSAGFWTGDTYVAALGDSLDVPPPPRSHVALHPGVNPGQHAPLPPTTCGTCPFAHKHAQDSDRHWESPQHRDDLLRQQAMQTRPRFRNEAHWSGTHQRSRSPHWETSSTDYASRIRDDHRRVTEDNRVRAREEAVACNRASTPNAQAPTPGSLIGHRYGNNDAPRIVPSPELRLAPRDSDVHPLAPETVRCSDPDYVGSDNRPASDFDYVEREESRLADLRARPPNPNETVLAMRLRDSRLGLFLYLQIATLMQALNIVAWLRVAQQEAYEMFSLIVQNCSARPLEFRSEGEAYLLRNQQEIERNWWIMVTGRPRPPRHVWHSTAKPRGGHRAHASNRYISGPASSTSGSSVSYLDQDTPHQRVAPPATAATMTVAMGLPEFSQGPVGVGAERANGRAYLGAAPHNPTNNGPEDPPGDFTEWMKLPNSITSFYAVLHYYVFLATADWVSGLRNMMRQIPVVRHDTPLTDDVLAYHTMLAMAPVNRRGVPHQFRRFFDTAILMFSIPGLFNAIILAGGYPAAVLALAHYPFLTDNIVMAQVASWFVQHGITTGSPDVLILESFARARRNSKADNADLENTAWLTPPRTIEEAIAMFPVPAWHELEHAPPAVPDSTTLPRNPAALGLVASLHAPMTGVEGAHTTTPPAIPDTNADIHLDGDAAEESAVGGLTG